MNPEKLRKSTTTDGKPPREGWEDAIAPAPIKANGQHEAYWVLTEEERSKGFIRPVRRTYIHKTCGTATTMGRALAETYAVDPKYYGATFCCGCNKHLPVGEFVWDGTNEIVGS
jgi:hypothetical protein